MELENLRESTIRLYERGIADKSFTLEDLPAILKEERKESDWLLAKREERRMIRELKDLKKEINPNNIRNKEYIYYLHKLNSDIKRLTVGSYLMNYHRELEKDPVKLKEERLAEKDRLLAEDIDAVQRYFKHALAINDYNRPCLFVSVSPNRQYPSTVQSFKVRYVKDEKELIVDYLYPPLASLTYPNDSYYDTHAKNEFHVELSKNEAFSFYTDKIYRIALRVIAILFKADEYQLVEGIIFNGYQEDGEQRRHRFFHADVTKRSFLITDYRKVDPALFFNREDVTVTHTDDLRADQDI